LFQELYTLFLILETCSCPEFDSMPWCSRSCVLRFNIVTVDLQKWDVNIL